MRYFRFTRNPLSSMPAPTQIMLRFQLQGDQMVWKSFMDGDLIAVEDADMGWWGGPTDYNLDPSLALPETYKLFQETIPQNVNLASIPVWTAHLVPYNASPPAPQPWPPVSAVIPG